MIGANHKNENDLSSTGSLGKIACLTNRMMSENDTDWGEQEIRDFVEEMKDTCVCLFDADGRILTWNEGGRQIYKLPNSLAVGAHFSILFSDEDIASGEMGKWLESTKQSSKPLELAQWRNFSDGRRLWLEGLIQASHDSAGILSGYILYLRDRTAFKHTEEASQAGGRALADTEKSFRLMVDSVKDYAIYMLDPEGRVLTWNAGAERNKGYKPDEVLGKNYSMFFPAPAREARMPEQELAAAATSGSFETEGWRVRKDGEEFWALVTLTAIRDAGGELSGFAKVTRDMTETKLLKDARAHLAVELEDKVATRTAELDATIKELLLKNQENETLTAMVSKDLHEKEVLLREVYHRVKNNMQVVQSLLKMGLRTLVAKDARQAFDTAIQRVHVMAMVHEHLYRVPNLDGLTLHSYLRDVVDGAIASNSERPELIRLQFNVEEIHIPLDLAIPLGLLANELVSNCLKHGFPSGLPGEISVSAQRIPGAVRFAIQDSGPGLPENFDASKCKSMGLKLAVSLANQLGGRLEFTSNPGCRVEADLTHLIVKSIAARLSVEKGSLTSA